MNNINRIKIIATNEPLRISVAVYEELRNKYSDVVEVSIFDPKWLSLQSINEDIIVINSLWWEGVDSLLEFDVLRAILTRMDGSVDFVAFLDDGGMLGYRLHNHTIRKYKINLSLGELQTTEFLGGYDGP